MRCHSDTGSANPWWQGHASCLCTHLTQPGSALCLGSQRTGTIITHCHLLTVPTPACPARAPPASFLQIRSLLSAPWPLSLPGTAPLRCSTTASSLPQPLGPSFPLLWPRPGLSMLLAPGLEKPRSATACGHSQRPISCAKRPTRNSFQQLPPSCQHLLNISAPSPGSIQAMGGRHRQGHTRPHAGSPGSTNVLTDTHGASGHAHRNPHRHPRASPVHTQTHGPHLSVPSGRVEPRRGASCPCPGPPCHPGKPPANSPGRVLSLSLSDSWGQRSGRGFS